MPKVVAVASGDWHIHKFKNFNEGNSRLKWCMAAMIRIAGICREHKVPLLFTGDLVHSPKDIENQTNTNIISCYADVFHRAKVHFYGISGNHDFSEKNSLEHYSPSHLDILSQFTTFHKMDYEHVRINDVYNDKSRIRVCGIPYFNNDLDLRKQIISMGKDIKQSSDGFKILMVHTDIPGATTVQGFEVNETEYLNDWDKITKYWDLVIAGHIHRPQKIGKRTYMLGPPIQQTLGEEGIKCGVWLIYSDKTIKFKPLEGFPKFIRLEKRQKPYNDLDYFVEYQETLVDESEENKEFALNNSRKSLATAYCDVKNIRSKNKRKALIKILNEIE